MLWFLELGGLVVFFLLVVWFDLVSLHCLYTGFLYGDLGWVWCGRWFAGELGVLICDFADFAGFWVESHCILGDFFAFGLLSRSFLIGLVVWI